MNHSKSLISITFLISVNVMAADEFSEPWTLSATTVVIDPYRENDINWDAMSKDSKVVAIIHKATEGLTPDAKYKKREVVARQRGYLWGSYHLGRPGSPEQQADKYLETIGDNKTTLMALDLEAISSKFMSLEDANTFMKYVQTKTNRLPLLYSNKSVANEIVLHSTKYPYLAKAKLWYVGPASKIKFFPNPVWKTYTLWQFSSELNCVTGKKCLYAVPGTEKDMDINIYYGDEHSLRDKWPLDL